ncbi:mitochondrial import inner membrane translocase subunit Tim54 [Xylariomycetidae sp. FL0641]|nr:mitochondrial import inner membrane translocase subunit Tim54 [Xylariomycetidae sp. FL0641]
MADPNPPPTSGAGVVPPAGSAPTTTPPGAATYKAPKPNRALQMMGLPNLPKKLPSRNWMIFWTLTGTLTAAIVYDRREKTRATARWARAVSHLGHETIASPNQLPRKLTVYLESPPTDGLRVAQDHYTEYAKPVLAASGLDWEFVQGRQEGDVRAAVAERIRRARARQEDTTPEARELLASQERTTDELVAEVRRRNGTPEYEGVKGDIVIGRHTWKEYVRGLHEGWLGPLTPPPPPPEPEIKPEPAAAAAESTPEGEEGKKPEEETKNKEEEEKKKKPERPPQIPPYNAPSDYATSALPAHAPSEFSPSAPIQFPHILGFRHTFTRLGRFLNRRQLADDIGREVAAACMATSRAYQSPSGSDEEAEAEQQRALAHEEKDWPKSVWKEAEEAESANPRKAEAERVWTRPVALDPRIAERMRRFAITPEEEARARAIVVPEEEVEGWIKGSLRSLWRWTWSEPKPRPHSSRWDE